MDKNVINKVMNFLAANEEIKNKWTDDIKEYDEKLRKALIVPESVRKTRLEAHAERYASVTTSTHGRQAAISIA